jgi:hypothetical protein
VNHPILQRLSGILLVLFMGMAGALAQTQPLASSGKEFWVGFMQNAYGAQSLRLNIAAPVGATGTVSMPLTGWSAPFSVAANGQATITVPNNAEHTGSEAVTDKGVLVESDNDIAVTAISYQSFTTDVRSERATAHKPIADCPVSRTSIRASSSSSRHNQVHR